MKHIDRDLSMRRKPQKTKKEEEKTIGSELSNREIAEKVFEIRKKKGSPTAISKVFLIDWKKMTPEQGAALVSSFERMLEKDGPLRPLRNQPRATFERLAANDTKDYDKGEMRVLRDAGVVTFYDKDRPEIAETFLTKPNLDKTFVPVKKPIQKPTETKEPAPQKAEMPALRDAGYFVPETWEDVADLPEVKKPAPEPPKEPEEKPKKTEVEEIQEIDELIMGPTADYAEESTKIIIPLIEGSLATELGYDLGTGGGSYTLLDYLNMKIHGKVPDPSRYKRNFESKKPYPSVYEVERTRYPEKEINALFANFAEKRKAPRLPEMVELSMDYLGRAITLNLYANTKGEIEYANKIARYTPTYSSSKYDRAVFTITASMQNDPRFAKLYDELYEIAETHYFGANGPAGQVERFKSVHEVHTYFLTNAVESPEGAFHKPIAGLRPSESGYNAFFLVLNQVVPLKGTSLKIFDDSRPRAVQEAWEKLWADMGSKPPYSLIRLDPASNAGILYPDQKHMDVSFDEIMNASVMMRVIGLQGWQEFLEPDFVSLCEMKPKAEVYEREKVKVRNIFATSMSFFIPAQMMLALSYHDAPTFTEQMKCRSLYGFSPFKGGMTAFMRFCMTRTLQPGTCDFLVYSDNIYFILQNSNERLVMSMDGSKMEASHNLTTTTLSSMRWASKTPSNPTWMAYMLNVLPRLAAEAKAVIGSSVLPVPGLASGSVGTMQFNHEVMAYFGASFAREFNKPVEHDEKETGPTHGLREVKARGDLTPDLFHRQANNYARRHGIILTLEKVTTFKGTRLNDFESDIINRYDVNSVQPKIMETDVLGFDCVPTLVDGSLMFRPALAKQRLLKSCIWHKFTVYNKDKDPIREEVLKMVIYKVLYAIGGYAHDALSTVLDDLVKIQAAASGLRGNAKVSVDVETIAEAVGEKLPAEILSLLGSWQLNTVAELNHLHFGSGGVVSQFGFLNQGVLGRIGMRNPTVFTLAKNLDEPLPSGVTYRTAFDNGFTHTMSEADLKVIAVTIRQYFAPEFERPIVWLGDKFGSTDYSEGAGRYTSVARETAKNFNVPLSYKTVVIRKPEGAVVEFLPGVRVVHDTIQKLDPEEFKSLYKQIESELRFKKEILLPSASMNKFDVAGFQRISERKRNEELDYAINAGLHSRYPKLPMPAANNVRSFLIRNGVVGVYFGSLHDDRGGRIAVLLRILGPNHAEKRYVVLSGEMGESLEDMRDYFKEEVDEGEDAPEPELEVLILD